MDYIIYFAITIAILVFVHEFGHFAAAKLSGMRADIFAIGFGKRLLGWNKISGFSFGELPKDFDGQGHTDYRLCLLPLGGYVKIAGMVDESFDTNSLNQPPQPYEFRSKSLPRKVFVITAGVLMNLLLAWLIFWGANFFQEKEYWKTTTISEVLPGSLADSLGFKSNDKILSINNSKVTNWQEVSDAIYISTIGDDVTVEVKRNSENILVDIPRNKIPEQPHKILLVPVGITLASIDSVISNAPADKAGIMPGDILLSIDNSPIRLRQQATEIISSNANKLLPITVKRGQDTLNLSVKPGEDGTIGVFILQSYTGPVEYKTHSFFESFMLSWQEITRMTELTFKMFGKVISGKVEFGKAFGGPIKIAQFAAKSADSGILSFLYFLALLSLSLAILNIMPFPVLDGGHLVIILIESIIRKEIPIKVKVAIQNVGFVLLLILMAFILYNDILSI
ncbi:MAG: RIP metalloprotease RseP [Ignavibacteriaceae bacterium]|nr:RIP metalloprotease RseP [Ignavibacteriaceae bacterium]